MKDEEQLRQLSTADLVRHALDEAKLLAKVEVLHAKEELKEELQRVKIAGILGGAAMALALSALSVLFVAVAIALPLSELTGLLGVGVALLVCAATAGFVAYKQVPRKPLARTQERLKKDLAITREQLA